jgi:hypothetical protein
MAGKAKTNLATVAAQLRDFVEGFDLESTEGYADRLADVVFDDVVKMIRERTLAGRAADGSRLIRRERDYARTMGDPLPGVRTGRMLSEEELGGIRHVSPARATMRYGTSVESRLVAGYFQEGTRARTHHIEDRAARRRAIVARHFHWVDADLRRAQVEKLTDSPGYHQPPRPFYDITEEDRKRLVNLVKDRLRKRAEKLGMKGGWKTYLGGGPGENG